MPSSKKFITITDDGVTLPIHSILTGRGFITGKSGSGKSNTASVIIEELLKNKCPLMVIDTDGEYNGLKEKFKDIIHIGQGSDSDVELTMNRVDSITDIALVNGVPIILDVSNLKPEKQKEIINEIVTQLFDKEKQHRKQFLLVIEEVHEFLSQQGGVDELARNLIRIAKRGRKRGLGICGISQRPSAVDKDFITQCNWSVWHRFTWAADKKAVTQTLGTTYANQMETLGTGEAFMATDWDAIQRIKLKQKETFDDGATPLSRNIIRPDFTSGQSELIDQLLSVKGPPKKLDVKSLKSENSQYRSRIKDLENHISELTSKIASAQNPIELTDDGQIISDIQNSIPEIPRHPKNFNFIWELGQLLIHTWYVIFKISKLSIFSSISYLKVKKFPSTQISMLFLLIWFIISLILFYLYFSI